MSDSADPGVCLIAWRTLVAWAMSSHHVKVGLMRAQPAATL